MIHYPTTAVGCCNGITATSHNNNKSNNTAISLPVCAKCKRNYKTRDNCRIKFGHNDVPWTNSYICITIDESCIGEDEKYIVDDKLHAVVLSPPPDDEKTTTSTKYEVQTCLDVTAPVCTSCKQSKRTKEYCRTTFRHKELPWNTLIVILKLQQNMTGHWSDDMHVSTTAKVVKETKQQQCPQEQHQKQEQKPKELEPEFDINCIATSRTFLSVISSNENSIRWLKRAETDDDDNTEKPQQKLHESAKRKKKKKTMKVVATATTKKKKSKQQPTSSKPCDKQKLENSKLALEAIEHAKQQANKEQDAARLMRQRFVRFTQQPQLQQQQQQAQFLLQQQAIYQLQDTTQEQSGRSNADNDDLSYGDEKMPAADSLDDNGEDILDDAAKLAEWL